MFKKMLENIKKWFEFCKLYLAEPKYIKRQISMFGYIKCCKMIEKYETKQIKKRELNEFLDKYGMQYNNK